MTIVPGGTLPAGYTYVAPRAAVPVAFQPGLLLIKPQYTTNPDTGNHPTNILWFKSNTTTTPTGTNLQSIASVFDNGWGSLWQQVGATSQSYLGSIITDWSNNQGLVYNSVGTATPAVGTQGTLQPRNVAAILSYRTAEHFRGGHGRSYLPAIGITALQSDPDLLTSTATAAIASHAVSLQGAMSASTTLGGQLWMVYRNRRGLHGTPTLWPITAFSVQTAVGSQRRRLRKAPHH